MKNIEQIKRKEIQLPLCITAAIVSLLLMVGGSLDSSESRVAITPSQAPTPSLDYGGPEVEVTPVSDDAVQITAVETPAPYAAPYYVDGKRRQ